MSHIALNRGLKILHYLAQHKSARFKDLSNLLDPISPASQMRLLRTLTDLGEVKKENNQYRLSSTSVFQLASVSHPFSLNPETGSWLDSIVRKLARETSYSAALFGWTTPGTMMILNSYTPIGSDAKYRPPGVEWPLIPFHDYALLFLAYAPGFMREDAFFRWNTYLSDDYKSRDFKVFINRLNNIKKKGINVPPELMKSNGSIVCPIFLYDEPTPRFSVGLLVCDKPGLETIEQLQKSLQTASEEMADILRGSISQNHLELDLSRAQNEVESYIEPQL